MTRPPLSRLFVAAFAALLAAGVMAVVASPVSWPAFIAWVVAFALFQLPGVLAPRGAGLRCAAWLRRLVH